ncbi:cytochrome c oxidase subunit I [soil metagenome]
MAVTETPPETAGATASAQDSADAGPQSRPVPTGLAAVLGSGDHKVIGRLYIATSLLFGLVTVVLGGAFALESTAPATLEVFTTGTVFQFFTLYRVATVFLVALPLVIGVAMAIVPLQVGARSIAFPRAAAGSYWAWLMGSLLLIASYAIGGGPGGGRTEGVHLWIGAMGVVVVAVLVAALCLATTVLALRTGGLTLVRIPLYAWSVLVAAFLWLLTLPVLLGLLVLIYADNRHGGGTGFGANEDIYRRITWLLRNPQIYVVAIPVLGFVADVLATTARVRIGGRAGAQGAIAAFGVLGFGAFLVAAGTETYETPLLITMAALAVLPVLAVAALAGDLFRRGTFRVTAGALYAASALLVLLLATAAGALGAIPALETTDSIYDLGVSHAVVLASVIAGLGGLHWWSTKLGRQPADEFLGRLAPLVLLVGAATVVIPDLASGIAGTDAELRPDWTGGIEALNWVIVIGTVLLAAGLVLALASLRPLAKRTDREVPTDPWEGQSLEWLAPSPPPLANFPADLPPITSAEPLVDQREET